jgi:hypothetical protein
MLMMPRTHEHIADNWKNSPSKKDFAFECRDMKYDKILEQ